MGSLSSNPKSKKKVVVGMSGGVDSSVVALLLQQQGYEVIGLFMKNWDEDDEDCPSKDDFEDVARVCSQLKIPYYTVNFSKEYWDRVFSRCLKEFESGQTPNPDILCNREIKFDLFFNKALSLGADFVATGHYCRRVLEGENYRLAKGVDPQKDQSYFLYDIDPNVLSRTLFPLGEMEKTKVRAIAREYGLATQAKKDSTGICFVGKRNFKDFLSTFVSRTPGEFRRLDGTVVGQHDGISFYTIGQRKGLKIGGAGDAWYVVAKDCGKNIVYLEQGDDHPALYREELFTQDINWLGPSPQDLPFRCAAKVRYRQQEQACTLFPHGDGMRVLFDKPVKAVTPGQSIVFYKDDICHGGGLISLSSPIPCTAA